MSFQTKPIREVLAQPGPVWELTVTVKEVDEGKTRRLWVTGLRADKPLDRKRATMALEFALNMLRNEKWVSARDALFASAP